MDPPGIGQPFHVKHVVFMDTETTGLAGKTGTLVIAPPRARAQKSD
jgi:uncharacterized protein YprB with RNaseH-like and TPR domain